MKLKDLKQGMVCKLRNKESITIIDRHFFTRGFLTFALEKKYNEDLKHKEYKQLDIMEITYGDKVVFKRNESRWFVPKDGERYYFLSNYGETVLSTNDRSETDYEVFDNCKVFKTKEEAVKRLRQQQATLSVERWIAENDVEVDLNDEDVVKYHFTYDVETKEFKISSYYYRIITPKQFILSSEEKVRQLIEEREKELKILFGVEE